MKFEQTNDSTPFTSYTIKLVDDSTHLTKTLDISDNFIDDLAKVIPKYYGTSNIFLTPDLYSNATKSFVRNSWYIGYINVPDNLFLTFRQILNDNEININRLYECKCSTLTTVEIQEEDLLC